MRFIDIANPTEAELREWAYDPRGEYPEQMEQDWDLIVADWSRIDLITELAADPACPNSGFFVGVLYLMAGDCVRTPSGGGDIPSLSALLSRLENSPSEPLRLFRTRALALLAAPSTFDYELWCDGGYARGRGTGGRWSGWRPRTLKEGLACVAGLFLLALFIGAIVLAIRGVIILVR